MVLLSSFIFVLVLIWCIWFLLKKFFVRALPPGPMGLPIFGSFPFLHPDLHSYFTTLAKCYGPILSLRLGQKIFVVISTPSVAREVLKDKDAIFANRDTTVVANVGFYGGSDILWSPYGPELRMMRKVFTQELLNGRMADLVCDVRSKEVRNMVNRLWNRKMSLVDIGEETFTTVLNSISAVLWGYDGKEVAAMCLGTEFRLFVEEVTMLMGKPNISDFIPCLRYFDLQGIEKRMKRLMERFDKIFDFMIEKRMKDEDKKKDFLQILLNLRTGGGHNSTLTMSQLKAILMDMVIGGTDTTTNTIEFAMAEMINNQDIMMKAQRELEVVVGKNNIVEESHIKNLPYLYAIMKETLRLHPSVPLLGSRCPSNSSIVNGYRIPKGATVLVNVWKIHRDPSIWKDPLEFDPERFMRGKWDYSGNDFSYLPFGSGRRICVGKQLSEKMFLLVMGSLLHSFDWKVGDGEKVNLEEKFGFALKKKKPLVVMPIPRLSYQDLYE